MSEVADALTDRQREIYCYLLRYFIQEQRFPSLREIGLHFKMKSPSGVMGHLRALSRKGWLDQTDRETSARNWRFTRVTFSPTFANDLIGVDIRRVWLANCQNDSQDAEPHPDVSTQ